MLLAAYSGQFRPTLSEYHFNHPGRCSCLAAYANLRTPPSTHSDFLNDSHTKRTIMTIYDYTAGAWSGIILGTEPKNLIISIIHIKIKARSKQANIFPILQILIALLLSAYSASLHGSRIHRGRLFRGRDMRASDRGLRKRGRRQSSCGRKRGRTATVSFATAFACSIAAFAAGGV